MSRSPPPPSRSMSSTPPRKPREKAAEDVAEKTE
jgi:hypothetical protein